MADALNLIGLSLAAPDSLYLKGIQLSRRTNNGDLALLIKRLRPYQTKSELIRVGNMADGGYLLPNDFEGISTCFSAGCDLTWHFEKQLDLEYGIKSVILDSEDKRPSDLGFNQTYVPYWLGNENNSRFMTFETWISKNSSQEEQELILQMDIEGAEYQAFLDLDEDQLKRFRIIVLELHNLANLKNRKLFNNVYLPVFEKLTSLFDVVHVHANNCCGNWKSGDIQFPKVLEITLLRKDRNGITSNFANTPHELDIDCVPSVPTLRLEWPT